MLKKYLKLLKDIDECASPLLNNCDASIEECENTEGSYKCNVIPKCDPGYQPSVYNDTICVGKYKIFMDMLYKY